MPSSRKKPLTEVEKLKITNCVGRRFISPRNVTPESNNNILSETNQGIQSIVDLCNIKRNLTNEFDDESCTSSKDSSFAVDIDICSDANEEIIKDLPCDTVTVDTVTVDTVTAAESDEEAKKNVVYTAEVIEKMNHKTTTEFAMIKDENMWLEEEIKETSKEILQDVRISDVPVVLVDDDDSVFFTPDDSKVNSSEKTHYETEMEKLCKGNKAHMLLCKTLCGNSLLDTMQLESKIMTNLLCLHCVRDKQWNNNEIDMDITAECGVVVSTARFGFAFTLSVQCVRQLQSFSVEPERAP